ncbi:SDR family oxidoreductase [Ramlibacter monticola]|uniref:NAD-dependent epimerase/dehydratase family protein n=1 Tax=Ramlibacter monticola TaxID=1926872 RepID=A0A936Z8M4_9BURK|nr:D-erythronate dehydrogenase [Ramlibacter monticola]MBL0394630.1 NAD-dependent epimerase/dehydratase family protein [Ramlibacter monticola]
MNILITGGSGFLGARLARTLLSRGTLALAGGAAQRIASITLTDRAPPPQDLQDDARVRFVGGDLNELLAGGQLPQAGTDCVFHLAAAVSGECEADFDLGMRSNFAATQTLLANCRALGTRPTVVFASSLAVFGKLPGQPMPTGIDDFTLPTPQSSYGIQKFVGEQLMADYGRKGFIRARSVRLMTVSVRPGRPNGAASGFLSGMLREPLAGVRAQVPVAAATVVALASPGRTIEGIVRAAEASDAEWGPLTAVNLPALRTTVGEMAAALERVAGSDAAGLLDWTPDPAIERLVSTWPGDVKSTRAQGLGLRPDGDFESIVREYVRENPQAVKLPVR